MKKVFIMLGNGFTIDFLEQYSKFIDKPISDKIDVSNLFRFGDRVNAPSDNKPGLLSFKNSPSLWTLGARPYNTKEEAVSLIEEIITCVNMFYDFVDVDNKKQKEERTVLETAYKDKIYLRAFAELNTYLCYLFSYYNALITDTDLTKFLHEFSEWGWINFFREILESNNYEKITIITYNYDIWLERILKILKVSFSVSGFRNTKKRQIELIKPHGSISFKIKSIPEVSTGNPSINFKEVNIGKLEVEYVDLEDRHRRAIIPPAGDSMRMAKTKSWAQTLRRKAMLAARDIGEDDEVVLCGISYWHVDRKELDEILINLNQNSKFVFINPKPPRDLNAVLSSIFKNYVYQQSSSGIGGILSG